MSTLDNKDQDKYNEPMVWIGFYIATASSICILAMATDLFHGFQNKKLWIPCKYFRLNTVSITVITVAMKLPVDISSDMPTYIDQGAKLGNLAFLCAMMANFMPSLASMDNGTLLANIIGLSILVITIIVNIFIDIHTGVIKNIIFEITNEYSYGIEFVLVAYIYASLTLLLLIIMISSSLTIPTSKEILEVKYQSSNKTCLTDQHIQTFEVEKLRQDVRIYWIMAETSSPQYVMSKSPFCTAVGLICVTVLGLNLAVGLSIPFPFGEHVYDSKYKWSVYKWSVPFIAVTQFTGVCVGTMAPVFRWLLVFRFELVTKWDNTHLKVFKVEEYCTQKLREWKRCPIHFLSSGRTRTTVYNLKSIIMSLCIILQKVVIIFCKLISLIPTILPIFVVYSLYCCKLLKTRWIKPPLVSRRSDNIDEEGLSNYVLHMPDEKEFAKKIVTRISNSMNSIILKAEKEQSKDLLELLKRSTGFKGVENFDMGDPMPPLLSVQIVNSWSLPIVTITCIAVALPNICKDAKKSLLKSVGDGLSYTHLVEKCLNRENEYVNTRKATTILWNEVEHSCKWLDKSLNKYAFRGKTATEILKWFSKRGKEIVTEIDGSISTAMVENTSKELIAANSMYRIAETILLRDESNTDQMNEKQLFTLLNSMIADIFCACFTNIPRVILVKCNESVIEKREASVKAAAKLLGKTTKIIKRLETWKLPDMDPDKMSYIDEWRLHLKQSIP